MKDKDYTTKMKSIKINKRDIKIFFFGMLTMLALATAYDWENNWAEFNKGWNAARASNSNNN